jgi:hypothetical protein
MQHRKLERQGLAGRQPPFLADALFIFAALVTFEQEHVIPPQAAISNYTAKDWSGGCPITLSKYYAR